MNGVLVIDKPAGWTSHDVVNKVRRLTGERSVGHLGTLDPLATGALPLLLGRMTRLAQFFHQADKEYEGEIRLGFATDTYDAEGESVGDVRPVHVDLQQVRRAAERFRGVILQIPPPFSAKKISGIPAYKLARAKQPVDLKPVEVEVYEFDVHSMDGPKVTFSARVKGGTYIRSLAHELGKAVGTGGHLASLRRTRSGEFAVADAVGIPDLEAAAADGRWQEVLLPMRRVLPEMPSVNVTEEQLARVRHGNAVNLAEFTQARLVKVFAGAELIAVASRVAGTLFQPKVVLAG